LGIMVKSKRGCIRGPLSARLPPPIQTNHAVIQATNMVRRVPGTDTLRQFFQPLQVKGGIPIGIRYEQELAAIRARITAPPVE
jgi:hypothetical protein